MEGTLIIILVTALIGFGSIYFFGKDNAVEKVAEEVIEHEVHDLEMEEEGED
jgi:hypothetical protein